MGYLFYNFNAKMLSWQVLRNVYCQAVLCILGVVSHAQSLSQEGLKRSFLQTPNSQYESFFSNFDERLKAYSSPAVQRYLETLQGISKVSPEAKAYYYALRSSYRFYHFQKNYILSDSLLQVNLIYTRKKGLDLEQAEILLEKGFLYSELYKYPEAISYMEQAYTLFYQKGRRSRAALVQYEIGNTCYIMHEGSEKHECTAYFERVLSESPDSLPSVIKISSYTTLGILSIYRTNYSKAIANFEKALNLAISAKDSAWIGISKGNIGVCLLKMGKSDEALPYLEEDLKSSLRHKSLLSASTTCRYIGQLYFNKKNYPKATYYFLQGIEMTKKGENLVLLKHLYKELAQTYQEEKRLDKALTYFQLHIQISDSLSKQNKDIVKIKTQSAFDLQKKENEVKAIIANTRSREQITIAIFISFSFLILSVFLIFRIRQNAKINQLLLSRKQALEEKNKQLEVQQNEIESQNEELRQGQEEIAAQRDMLSEQNQKLQQVQEIIKRQNEEIQLKNQDLEEQVKARTYKLVEYNNQLEEFAFITAHNLRAPVSRILGLGQLFYLPNIEAEEEKIFVEKLVEATQELDEIVKEMSVVLNQKHKERAHPNEN